MHAMPPRIKVTFRQLGYYVALKTRLRPLALGLATMKSDKKARVLQAVEDHCRSLITDRTIPGMRPRPFA